MWMNKMEEYVKESIKRLSLAFLFLFMQIHDKKNDICHILSKLIYTIKKKRHLSYIVQTNLFLLNLDPSILSIWTLALLHVILKGKKKTWSSRRFLCLWQAPKAPTSNISPKLICSLSIVCPKFVLFSQTF